jgi:hypothetical protein
MSHNNNFFIGHNVDVDNFSKFMVCFMCENHTDAMKFMDDPTGFPNDMFLVHPAAVTNAFNVGDFTFIHTEYSFFTKVSDFNSDMDDTDDDDSESSADWAFDYS